MWFAFYRAIFTGISQVIQCTVHFKQNIPLRLLETRFTDAISCFENGPQEPYMDILLNTLSRESKPVIACENRTVKCKPRLV
jgi:hypothetical protein